ncbi:tetratricopeptide repeat protein [Cytophagaceae bacterium ABcell3]|nr:tetratricopeptide repeat protein [Cytophagaceae bacterium ABcell3]
MEPHTSSKKKDNSALEAEGFFIDGMRYYVLENYDDAKRFFEKAYGAHPENAAVNYMLSKVYNHKKENDLAVQYGVKSVKYDSKNKYYYLHLSELYENKKQYAEAIKVLKKMLSEVPDASEHYFDLAAFYVYEGDFEAGLKYYQKAEDFFGKTAELTRQKQQLLLRMNKLDEAIAEGESYIKQHPEEKDFQINHIEMLYHNDRVEQAIKRAEGLIANNPEFGNGYYILAGIYLSEGKYNQAFPHLDAVFAHPEVNIDAKLSMLENLKKLPETEERNNRLKTYCGNLRELHPEDARSLAASGDVYFLVGDKNNAWLSYLEARELNSDNFGLWNQILMLDIEMGNADSLITHSNQALELFPNQAVLWLYNGSAHLMKKQYEDAIDALEEGLKMSASNKDLNLQFKLYLADGYNGAEDYEKSDALYTEVLTYDSNNAHALNNFSYFLSLRNENLDKAVEMSAALISRYPDNPNYLDTHAWVLYKQQKYEEAKELLKKAASMTENGTIWEHYGDVLFKLGDVEKALEKWRKAKEFGDTTDQIDKKIQDKKLYE